MGGITVEEFIDNDVPRSGDKGLIVEEVALE
jgi:hypothetical protein